MKEIKINRLTLENFKCHRLLNLVLDGQPVSIYGDNATGKTSIYDALTWLLFGKDSMGNGEKNIDIKPLDGNGEVKDHQAITSVEAEFLVDGQVQTFQRTYREVWATRRGTGTPVYEGNTSDYFVNGVPCKKNAFDAAIKEMVSEDLFRMLTSVSHFAANMKWQERRAVLFDMAGTLTDKEIMVRDERFTPLLDSLGNLSLQEFKTKLLHQKKGQTGIRDDSPTRINECQRTLQDIAGIDFAAAREEEKELFRQRETLNVQLLALDQDTVLDKKRLELREAKFERDQLESRNKAHRESQRKNGRDLSFLYNEISREQASISQSKNYLAGFKRALSRIEKEIQDCREEWVQVNGEAFAGGKCPTCGQALPFEQLQAATETFNIRKEIRLASITGKAKDLQKNLEQTLNRNQEIEEEISRREAHIQELNEQIRKAKEEVAPVTDLPEYAECIAAVNSRVDALQAEISSLMADSSKVREQLRADLNAADGQLRFVQGVLAKEAIKTQTEKRIEQLKADARNAAGILERIEQMLYLMEEFTRYKAKFVEQSINDHFRIATFRLFREQANGGLEERCDVVYDGVPFMGLNNGMKVNVGIDIINALSRHYGVTVPLFVDNAEAVTRLEPCNSQVIRLVVSEEDKELRIV
ncbi:MAG: AAA family ATPase [Oscillospiraceae bacterium]|nr:AAA family ATPase [Oscillospiraceae bacterium]